ncbi:MAG: PilZ domain-containing protein [Candidatus Omnitrophota bacterium]
MVWEGMDERRFPRVKYTCLIKVHGEDQEKPIEAFTENIGTGGVCVIVEKEFKLFEGISLEIALGDGGDIILCKGTIVWVVKKHCVKKLEKNTYDVGVEFLDILKEDKQRVANLVQAGSIAKT